MMVHAKIREGEKNHGLLTLWELLKLLAPADVEVGQSFAITEPFGHCVEWFSDGS